ncbi:hypothetical protein MGA3_15411 [Bacillus methanolicus MGA3]|nr:hypothetical protein MGA3_15411 [Bacillus methanolicus MGA3]
MKKVSVFIMSFSLIFSALFLWMNLRFQLKHQKGDMLNLLIMLMEVELILNIMTFI